MKKPLKNDHEKTRMDLIEKEWLAGIGEVMTQGALMYGEQTWKKVEGGRYEAALLRHYCSKDLTDRESGLSKWLHVAINALFLYSIEEEKFSLPVKSSKKREYPSTLSDRIFCRKS